MTSIPQHASDTGWFKTLDAATARPDALALLGGTIAISLVTYVASTYVLAMGLLALGMRINGAVIWVALLLSAGLAVRLAIKDGMRPAGIAAAAMLVTTLVLGSVGASGIVYDTTWDGIAYHQEATDRLAHGWNPLHEHLDEGASYDIWHSHLPPVGSEAYNVFLNHYPKFNWVFAASHYAAFDNIETGKSYTLILAAALALLVFAAMRRFLGIGRAWSAVIALLALANQVLITQLFSYYTDQLVYLGFALTCMAAWTVFATRQYRAWLLFALCAVLLVNAKFTGLLYFVLICGSLVLFVAVFRGLGLALRFCALSLVAFLIAAPVMGYDTYVQNTIEHGHPFWPLYGEGAVDIMSAEYPPDLRGMGKVSRFFTSVFSAVDEPGLGAHSHLRPPFVIDSLREVVNSQYSDTRLSGFGVWFSGILVAALAALFCMGVQPGSRLARGPALFVVAALLATVFANPESWWARYVPQLWLLPVSTVALLCVLRTRPAHWVACGLAAAMVVNSGVTFGEVMVTEYHDTAHVRRDLYYLKMSRDPVYVFFSEVPGVRSRFEDSGIHYRAVSHLEDLPCSSPVTFSATWHHVRYCL